MRRSCARELLGKVLLGGLVGAVLGPHDRVHCQLSRGRTATKNFLNVLELVLLQTQFGPGSSVVRGCRRVLDGVEVKLLSLILLRILVVR